MKGIKEIIYNGVIKSQADIETLRWLLGKWVKKEGKIRVIVEKGGQNAKSKAQKEA